MVHVPYCVTNDPPSESNSQSLPIGFTPIEISTPCNNPPKQVSNIPNDNDSDPSSLDYSSSNPSDSSDSGYFKQSQRTHKKHQVESSNTNPIKKCAKLIDKLLKAAYNYKVENFKLSEDPLQSRVYFLTFINSLKMIYHLLRKLA